MERKLSTPASAGLSGLASPKSTDFESGDLNDTLNKFRGCFAKKNRGKEMLDSLKPMYQLQQVRALDRISGKETTISQIWSLAQEKPMPFRIRAALFSILVERPPEETLSYLPSTPEKLRSTPSSSSLPSPSPASTAAQDLEPRLRDWCAVVCNGSDIDQMPLALLGIISIAKLSSSANSSASAASGGSLLLKYSMHVRPVEEKMCQLLINAAPDTKSSSGTGLFSTLMSAASREHTVLEPDGTALREFYTTLNLTQNPSNEHLFNVFCFVLLRMWIDALYMPTKAADGKTTVTPSHEMSTNLQEVVISYCNRIIEQCKLTRPAANTPPVPAAAGAAVDAIVKKHLEPPIENALVDAVRILDMLCTIDRTLVPSVFPIMKKAFNFASQHLNISMAQSVLVFLQFFLNHSDAVAYDPEPVFRFYFQTFLAKQYQNVLVALDTFHFCNQNKKALLNRTNVFGSYFPPLLKLYAWAPAALEAMLQQMIPALVSPSSFVELLHSLLDLPLLTATLERAEMYERSVGAGADVRGSADFLSSGGEFRVLYNHFLRNESGVTINFWHASTALTLLQQFCKSVAVTPRLSAVASQVPALLDLYFDVLILYGEEMHLKELVPLLFDRLDQLFPLPSFQNETRAVIVSKLLTIFGRYPSFVVTFKEIIINIIGHSKFSAGAVRTELFALCWLVGEYLSAHYLSQDVVTPALLSEYYEALESFLYERVSLARVETSSKSTASSPAAFDPLVAKLLLITISTVSKLAARCQDLSSRVILCLTKLLKQGEYFHPSVQQLANDSIQILKCPSIAPALLDSHSDEKILDAIDKHSSLSFLLQPTSPNPIVAQLHHFEHICQ